MKLGVGFSQAADGDLRGDLSARRVWASGIGAPQAWVTLRQVHGDHVVEASTAGEAGEADGVFTTTPGLGLAVLTADCAGVVIGGEGGVGVAHAGWRGAHAEVVPNLVAAMRAAGIAPTVAHIGPAIGPCCFEVGEEVARLFPGDLATTTWGTNSVDLSGIITAQLEELEVRRTGGCTFHDSAFLSHRRDGSPGRMAALAWLER